MSPVNLNFKVEAGLMSGLVWAPVRARCHSGNGPLGACDHPRSALVVHTVAESRDPQPRPKTASVRAPPVAGPAAAPLAA
jgi:hypothetical protein